MSAESKFPLKGTDTFKYWITYNESTPERREIGEYTDTGYYVEPQESELSEIMHDAYFNLGISSPFASSWWETTKPVTDTDYWEKGIHKNYHLHIERVDGTPLTQEEHDFITALMNEGKYRNDGDYDWYECGGESKYGIGGFLFGTLLGGFLGFSIGKSAGYGRAVSGYANGGDTNDFKEIDYNAKVIDGTLTRREVKDAKSFMWNELGKKYPNANVMDINAIQNYNELKDGDSYMEIYGVDENGKMFESSTYQGVGDVQAGDRVIITTKSLGKQYEGMTGEVTPRKLLNDKYSIKLENGMTMAFEKNEFIHDTTYPNYEKGGSTYQGGGEIKASELNKGYQYTYESDEDNYGSLYKENGIYHVVGFEDGKHFSHSFDNLAKAKKVYNSVKNYRSYTYSDGGDTSSWKEEAIAELREYENDDTIKLDREEDDHIVAVSDSGAEYMIFESQDEAEQNAIDRVKEDLEYEPYLFNESWLVSHIDENDAKEFFEDIYPEWDDGYAEDIRNELDDNYVNRLVAEMVDRGIMSLKEANSDDADSIAEERIDIFVESMINDKIEEDGIGYEYYKSNIGEEEARKLLINNNLIDIDEASIDAVTTDGVAHFLARYDGEEITIGSEDYKAYRTN